MSEVSIRHAPRNRSWSQRGKIMHNYYLRTGRYRLIGSHVWKTLLSLALLGLGIYLFNVYVIDIDSAMAVIFERFTAVGILVSFGVSESFLGLLPPDLYLVWAGTMEHPYIMAGVLGLLSYIGGIISFGQGRLLFRVPKIKGMLQNKYQKQWRNFHKYGGLLVALGALTPLPYAAICIIAGMGGYSFRFFVLLSITRILRFFLYALVLFNVMG